MKVLLEYKVFVFQNFFPAFSYKIIKFFQTFFSWHKTEIRIKTSNFTSYEEIQKTITK